MKKIAIVFTGTVASTLAEKIILTFAKDNHEVTAIFTEKSRYFINEGLLRLAFEKAFVNVRVLTDSDEWRVPHGGYKKDDKIPHIELAKENDLLLIIASADFMSKMVNGACDDLATSLYRAWHRYKPVILCPAMNTMMWTHPVTARHVSQLESWGVDVIYPVRKQLACGDTGIGALEDIGVIKDFVDSKFKNNFPLNFYSGIPVGKHPGAFLAQRKHAPHTGVDLYTRIAEPVFAMNDGIVVSVEDFTGVNDKSTWWNDTQCILIKHWFGVVCYGELETRFRVGDYVSKGTRIGSVKQVLRDGKERPDIAGHSLCMLHVELYPHDVVKASRSYELDKDILLDPTPFLTESAGEFTQLN